MQVNTSTDLFKFYRYIPSIPACILFLVLFSFTTTLHAYQLLRNRAYVLIPLLIGGIGESTGYILRIFSARESPDYTLTMYIAAANPTLLAPAFFAASIYMCLGRIIEVTGGERLSLVRREWLTKLFISGDVLGLLVQGAGAILMPMGGLQNFQTGSNIVIAGLALLVLSSLLFLLVTATFHIRLLKNPTPASLSTPLNWKRELKILYTTSILVFIRSIYRLVEYGQGNRGYLIRNEWTLYCFDAVLMLGVLVGFNFWYARQVEGKGKGKGAVEGLGGKGGESCEVRECV